MNAPAESNESQNLQELVNGARHLRAMMQSDQILTMIGLLPADDRQSTAGPVLGIYFNWTDRSIATRQFDQAQ